MRSYYHLNGVRSVIEVPSFPALRSRLCVFVQISGHAGEANCHIEIENAESGELIYKSGTKVVHFESPTCVEPTVFRLRNCMFSSPGVYFVQVIHENKMIWERPLLVRMEE